MVCKEDVLSWFKDASCYRRIDVMCSLLRMCVPLELRFLGSYVEEHAKYDYQELRGAAIAANDLDKLDKELSVPKGLLDEVTRHRLAVYLTLLHSRNYACADWMYRTVIRNDSLDALVKNGRISKEDNLHTEIVLVLTLTLNHPAFSFEHKQYVGELLMQLYEPEVPQQSDPMPCPPGMQGFVKPPFTLYPMPVTMPVTVAKTPVCPDTSMPPPGIPLPHMAGECVNTQGVWSRTHYINASCPPPELTNFPPPMSPLVSQQSSPTASRSVSPSRMYACRPPPPSVPLVSPLVDRLPPPVKEHVVLTTPTFNTDLKTIPIDEVEPTDCEKAAWIDTVAIQPNMKGPNGLVPVGSRKYHRRNLTNDLCSLSLNGEPDALQYSHSSGSSNSSDSHSPPDTPTELSAAPHGPGRGPEPKLRLNGATLPGSELGSGPLFTSCSVPYQYGPPPAFPHRFFTQAYRSPFPYPQQNGEMLYPFTGQYLPVMYSSAMAPPPSKSCYNCGMLGHLGPDCKEPSIEEITQKGGYRLEYVSPPPSESSADGKLQ